MHYFRGRDMSLLGTFKKTWLWLINLTTLPASVTGQGVSPVSVTVTVFSDGSISFVGSGGGTNTTVNWHRMATALGLGAEYECRISGSGSVASNDLSAFTALTAASYITVFQSATSTSPTMTIRFRRKNDTASNPVTRTVTINLNVTG